MSPDISMCDDPKCPQAKKCYRFTATPTPHWQVYFDGSPRRGRKCQYYMPDYRVVPMPKGKTQ